MLIRIVYLLSIIRIGYLVRTLSFSYSLKTGEMVTEFIYLSILYLNKKKGNGVVTCISTFVPILYHIYKRLSTDFNIYFKIIFYFLTH